MRRTIVDEVMEEHIRMPGFPSLIVTRALAWDWMMEMGYSSRPGGPADYAVFAKPPVDTPLTDSEEVRRVRDVFSNHRLQRSEK